MKKLLLFSFLVCATSLSFAKEEIKAPDFSKLSPEDMKEAQESKSTCSDATGTYSSENVRAYKLCLQRENDGSSPLVPLGQDRLRPSAPKNQGESTSRTWDLGN